MDEEINIPVQSDPVITESPPELSPSIQESSHLLIYFLIAITFFLLGRNFSNISNLKFLNMQNKKHKNLQKG